jgi:Methyltransferase domain
MEHIRPYQLLTLPDPFGEEVKFFMPQPQGLGSVSTIESILLLKLMRLVNPTYIFEFGTYKGLTTRLLLENLPENGVVTERIYTLDLPDLEDVRFQGTDKVLASEALGFSRKYLSSSRKRLVKQIFQDSMTLDPAPYLSKFQFIFVDANHELNYVRRDTENAFKMLSGLPSCIIWHDYGNPEFPELTQYLDGLSNEFKMYHIGDTMLAFHLVGIEVAPRKS